MPPFFHGTLSHVSLRQVTVLMEGINTPRLFVCGRKVLQYLLPKVWAAVASREWGKVAVQLFTVLGLCLFDNDNRLFMAPHLIRVIYGAPSH